MLTAFHQNLKYFYNLLQITGVYSPKNNRLWQKIYGAVAQLVFLDLFVFGESLYFFRIDNIIEFAGQAVTQLPGLAVSIKCKIARFQIVRIRKFLDDLQEFVESCQENQNDFGVHVEAQMQKLRKILGIFWISGMLAFTTGLVLTLLNSTEPPYKPQYKVYAFSFFNFEENYGYFLITEIYVYIAACFACTSDIATTSLPVLLLGIESGLLGELGDRIEAMKVEFKGRMTFRNRFSLQELEKIHEDGTLLELKKCIQIHQKIKAFVAESQHLVSALIFVQVMASTIILCMCIYMISLVSCKRIYFVLF